MNVLGQFRTWGNIFLAALDECKFMFVIYYPNVSTFFHSIIKLSLMLALKNKYSLQAEKMQNSGIQITSSIWRYSLVFINVSKVNSDVYMLLTFCSK